MFQESSGMMLILLMVTDSCFTRTSEYFLQEQNREGLTFNEIKLVLYSFCFDLHKCYNFSLKKYYLKSKILLRGV